MKLLDGKETTKEKNRLRPKIGIDNKNIYSQILKRVEAQYYNKVNNTTICMMLKFTVEKFWLLDNAGRIKEKKNSQSKRLQHP